MSKQDNQDNQNKPTDKDTRPWEKNFDNDRDDNGQLSRTATKKREHNNTIFVSILVVILLAVIGSTIGAWVAAQKDNKSPEIVVSSKKSTVKSSKKSRPAESSSATSSSSSVATESSEAASSSSVAESSSAVSSSTVSSESSSASTTEGGSYTVKAGDNLYRIAINNGLTLDQLLQLNGLSSNSAIVPGQSLRIK
ncbi:SAG1386/EF1546 family surface-associated protein [Lapidilactobacillus luobeiensis]|uniref:SAG1386/EF1546 family surface-associated protein n=1 Tax=Lapidilactobacillus luobeiensis TaxID=2950371 RepID=UPI0021C4924A|nr:SAG1386/EF1546 family surface-associated protein [Lapidilactobacillus luobeiensis]